MGREDSRCSRRRVGSRVGLVGYFRVIGAVRYPRRDSRNRLYRLEVWRLMLERLHRREGEAERTRVGLIWLIRPYRLYWRICCRWVLRRTRLRSMLVSSRATLSRTRLRLQQQRQIEGRRLLLRHLQASVRRIREAVEEREDHRLLRHHREGKAPRVQYQL